MPTSSTAARNGKGKLDKARAKRETSTTQAVAATIGTPKLAAPARPPHKPKVKNFVLPVDVINRGNRRITEFVERTGSGLSWSALAEVALIELFEREDFDAVIKRHGARARRPDVVK